MKLPPHVRTVTHVPGPAIRVWAVDVDAYGATVPLRGLPPAAYEQAERAASLIDGRRRLAGRHALRALLGLVLGRAQEDLRITGNEHGKPRLVDGSVEFNLSRSGSTVLVAVAEAPVGVDVERIRPVPGADGVVRHSFAPREVGEWWRAPVSDRDRTFLTGWTRKEACAKATGLGVAVPFVGLEVGCSEVTRRVPVGPVAEERTVVVGSLELSDRLVGAVAVEEAR